MIINKKGNGKEILTFPLATVDAKMRCLHGKRAGSRLRYGYRTPVRYNYCQQPSTCHFEVYSNDRHKDLYYEAVKTFLATNQKLPKGCVKIAGSYPRSMEDLMLDPRGEKTPEVARNYAKMKVVSDKENGNFGRPYFACSKSKNKCNYFDWGDQIIDEKPLCNHGKPSKLTTVKTMVDIMAERSLIVLNQSSACFPNGSKIKKSWKAKKNNFKNCKFRKRCKL